VIIFGLFGGLIADQCPSAGPARDPDVGDAPGVRLFLLT
jgi:hypothetical protein